MTTEEAEDLGLKDLPSMRVSIFHPHKCKCKLKAPSMGKGREWFIGELTEPLEAYPHETHCFHMTTPTKEVVWLMNPADFRNLYVLSSIMVEELYPNMGADFIELEKKHAKNV